MQEMYEKYKKLLFKLAYQLTGSVSDAEDVVHDVFLKLYDVPPEKLGEPKAYLCKMVTNQCRDLQKTARKKREQYFGDWLPEPLSNSEEDSMDSVVRDDELSYGLLVLVEKLTPTERVVFVLRVALGFEYHEIAELIEKSDANCRKIFSRASAKMVINSEEEVHSEAASQDIFHYLIIALKKGNLNQVLSMIKLLYWSQMGGEKYWPLLNQLKHKIMLQSFCLALLRRHSHSRDDHVENNMIRNINLVRNPDKLKHVGI